MHTRVLCVAFVALVCGCGDPAPAKPLASEPFDGTVTFFVDPGNATQDPGLNADTTVFLAVEKTGRTSLVDAWEEAAPEAARHGRHTFPAATTARAVAGYYGAVLANAGWKTPTDYHLSGASIHFYGVGGLRAGADRPGLHVTVEP